MVVAIAAMLLAPSLAMAAGPTVLTAPVDPNNPTSPHTTYPVTSTTEITIVLGATVPSAWGSKHMFKVDWNFADGTADTVFSFTDTGAAPSPYGPYAYDISTTHQYPASLASGTTWTAVVTVTDMTAGGSTSANYYVIQEDNNLSSRVNVAIDSGLWYLHQTMWRQNANSISTGNPPVNEGGWDLRASVTCNQGATLNSTGYFACSYYGSIDAENVQAIEVSGHFQNGPATDPYTDDVARGIARAETFIGQETISSGSPAPSNVKYEYDPSVSSYICADGTIPTTGDPMCAKHTPAGIHNYNPGAPECHGATTSSTCAIAYDANGNGLAAYSNDTSGEYTYTTSPFLEMLVASQTPNALIVTGPYAGSKFSTVVQDVDDFYGLSQYYYDCDVAEGNVRGNNGTCAGGGWRYTPQQAAENSTSQWAAIGFISAARGFGIPIPQSITDFNNVWVTNSEDADPTLTPAPKGTDPLAMGDNLGAFGYSGNYYYGSAGWGPFAETPSGMVQMAMDGIGRTKNTAFGDATTDFDQRWNNAETFYADNFCNMITNNTQSGGQADTAPRAYMYGMFSFTKSMLEHTTGGALAPIQYLRTLTPNVFTGDASVPPNTIDWYAALSTANGGTDACDGVAQTLVSFQQNPQYGTVDGHWFGNSSDHDNCYYECQNSYETAWALIMLRKTVFVSCIQNLVGRGTAGNILAKPRIDLTWSVQTNATSYNILRSTVSGGGPGGYTLVGTSTLTDFSDRTAGLINGDTYYYVVQPIINGVEICQSNEAKITIP